MSNDLCMLEGVCCLKLCIEVYWVECGYDVSVDLVDVGFMLVMCFVCIDVCLNLVNGMLICLVNDMGCECCMVQFGIVCQILVSVLGIFENL